MGYITKDFPLISVLSPGKTERTGYLVTESKHKSMQVKDRQTNISGSLQLNLCCTTSATAGADMRLRRSSDCNVCMWLINNK